MVVSVVLCILSFQNAEALGSGPVWCRRLPYTLSQEAQLLPSSLALPCPSEATSLAAPQAPQALQPLHGSVGKGALAGHCFPAGAVVSGALWGCPLPSLSPQDEQIRRERASQHLPGGCCALAAIYLMGKFYVANAGDSRYSPQGSPQLCSGTGDTSGEWGGAGAMLVRNTQLHPCLGEGGGGRTGQSSSACSMPWGQCALL